MKGAVIDTSKLPRGAYPVALPARALGLVWAASRGWTVAWAGAARRPGPAARGHRLPDQGVGQQPGRGRGFRRQMGDAPAGAAAGAPHGPRHAGGPVAGHRHRLGTHDPGRAGHGLRHRPRPPPVRPAGPGVLRLRRVLRPPPPRPRRGGLSPPLARWKAWAGCCKTASPWSRWPPSCSPTAPGCRSPC